MERQRPFKVVIAGGGIGGLVLALGLLKKGFDVKVFEKDVTAIRGEGKYRGPIQVQSNALAALEAIDKQAAEEIMATGCITGDRINGLCDGVSGDWYVKFDTFHPAVDAGMPVTRVINRVDLQQILTRHINGLGPHIEGNSTVTGFEQLANSDSVRVLLSDGRVEEADLLIGADGIWSSIRKQVLGETKANYAGYTCYTGISDFTPADIELVAYRVFLGNGQYFVSSDVGGGKMQWYGFHKEPAGGKDVEGHRKDRLLKIFGHWCDEVVDLIKETPEEDILRRDIYERAPIFSWTQGRVALLGDSAHAMQPNLGQGGCMAIEDAHIMAVLLENALMWAGGDPAKVDVPAVLKDYQDKRLMRAAAIHGMAGMAAFMASTYKAYLGEGLGPLSWIQKYKIPHPGRVVGQLILKATMPAVLGWVLGGYMDMLRACRVPSCRLEDKNQWISEQDFRTFMHSDRDLVRAMHAEWLLVPEQAVADASTSGRSWQEAGIHIGDEPLLVGRKKEDGCRVTVDDVHVNPHHAQVFKQGKDYFVRDLDSVNGTFVNGKRIPARKPVQLRPSDIVEFGRHPTHLAFKVKARHAEEEEGQAASPIPSAVPAGLAAQGVVASA